MRRAEDIHPDLRRAAAALPSGIFTRSTVAPLRAVTRAMNLRPLRHGEKHVLPDGTRVRLHRPRERRSDGALLWIHGGGYVVGSAAQDDALCRRLAGTLGVDVAAVDYRLAPKHPYPAALEDCYRALAWLAERPDIDPRRVAIGGASAGGGLTAALAITARERAEIAPVLQLLVYPMVNAPGPEKLPEDDRFRMWNHRTNRIGWQAYLGGADPRRVAPLLAPSLAGLAPAWLGVGTLDPLHDEGVAYAARLRDSGVDVDLEIVEGAFHGFDAVLPGAGVSRAFFGSQCAALRAALVD